MTTKAESAPVPGKGEITRLLQAMREGDPEAAEELLSHVYRELRALAAAKMAREAPGQTLQPTALVHEAWLRLGGGAGTRFPNRAYFFGAAGEAMRRILVENARRKKRLKHGGNLEGWTLRKWGWPRRCPMTTCWPWTKPSPASPSSTPALLSW